MFKWLKGNMPDITPAQVVASFFIGVPLVLTLVGVALSPEQTEALDKLRDLGLGLVGADAVIRVGRNVGSRPKLIESKPLVGELLTTTLGQARDPAVPPVADGDDGLHAPTDGDPSQHVAADESVARDD